MPMLISAHSSIQIVRSLSAEWWAFCSDWVLNKRWMVLQGRRKIGRPLRNSWRSHSQPLPGCWATSCSISGSTPFSHFLKVQYAYWDSELYCGSWDEKEAL